MNLDQVVHQAEVLDLAADESPIVTVKSMLRARAKEFKAVAKAWKEAVGDGIAEDQLEIVSAAMLEQGSRVYWPGMGPATVMRTSQNGGIQLDGEGQPGPEWVNVSSLAAPVLACP